MLPVGVLMIEHRLIERMIWLMSREVNRIKAKGIPDHDFLAAAADFIVNYVDRCHHGKEEQILFRDLSAKPLSAAHQKILRELLDEHAYAREKSALLDAARRKFCGGDYAVITEITDALGDVIAMYPCHIEKEDKHFFLPSMEYFTADEKTAMRGAFDEFDKNLFKEKYMRLVDFQEVAFK